MKTFSGCLGALVAILALVALSYGLSFAIFWFVVVHLAGGPFWAAWLGTLLNTSIAGLYTAIR